ncbi:Ca2+-binding RTX toxin-like protein [Chitinivorax tropicus]|uniref:Ca2+-binding RTX toxin-like protein n=1 Tax=Chitinivorax tropicus TaxID=714531 RepID=A0A840MNP5_9PROT|nr:calcium-binding protein [Chitinivorax tropicus]MBB5018372.1 Ca2+-binding RTX toxin-like protein [Chitinivorax tropicus]
MALEDLQQKLRYIADSFDFLLQQCKTIDNKSKVNSGKSLAISDYLGNDDRLFLSAIKAVGLTQTEGDIQNSEQMGKPILSRETLGNWITKLEYSKNSLILLATMLSKVTPEDEVKLNKEIQTLSSMLSDLNPSSGRARSYQLITSAARTYTQVSKIQYERSYEKLTSGLDTLISNEWKAKGLSIDPLKRIDFLQTKVSQILGGINLNDPDASTFSKNWKEWKENTLKLISPEIISKTAQSIHEGNLKANPNATLEDANKTAIALASYRVEAEEIPKLKGSLLNNSQYQLLATRYTERTKTQQFGRLLGSGGALLFAVPGEAVAAANSDEKTKHAINAALFATSALQVPFALALSMIEARAQKQSAASVLNDLYVSFNKNAEKITIKLPEKIERLFKQSASINLETVDTIDESKIRIIKSVGEEAKFNFLRGKALGKQMGKSTIFFAADLVAVASDIYAALNTPAGAVAGKVQVGLSLLQDTAFFASDLFAAVATGVKALRAAQGLAVAGAVIGAVNSFVNIAVLSETYKGDFSSEQAKWDLGNAVVGVAVGIAGIATAIACPPAALLFMLVPNFSSIGQAIQLDKTHSDFMGKGLLHEASVVQTLHQIAALDATPIVNWFSGIYTADLKGKMLKQMDAQWYQEAFLERLHYLAQNSTDKFSKYARDANVQNFHLITSIKQEFKYLGQDKNVSDWVDIGTNVNGKYTVNTSKKINDQQASNGVLQLDGVLNEQHSGKGLDSIYQIDYGDGESLPNLVLDNRRSSLDSAYINTNSPNVTIKAGSGDDMFILSEMLSELDGGMGTNTVSFHMATKGVSIDIARGTNIHTWKGSTFADKVRGTAGSDIYSSNGGGDTIDLLDGDDTAQVSIGDKLNMGNGDDRTFFNDISESANGGNGNDIAQFQGLRSGLIYSTTDIGEGQIKSGQRGPTGLLKHYEALTGTLFNDVISISQQDSLRTFGLDEGNDFFDFGAASDLSVFLGKGDDTLTSNGEAYQASWSNGSFFGGHGRDSLNIIMNNSDILVDGGEDNDNISLYGSAGNNIAEIVGGGGNDKISIRKDIATKIRFGTQDGTDIIYDDTRRTKEMILVVDGAEQKDVQITYKAYRDSARPPSASKETDVYGWTIEVKVGKTEVNVHTLTILPAEIRLITSKDGVVRDLDLLTVGALNEWTEPKLDSEASSSTTASQSADMLIQSMASFGADTSGMGTSHSIMPQQSPRMMMAASPM